MIDNTSNFRALTKIIIGKKGSSQSQQVNRNANILHDDGSSGSSKMAPKGVSSKFYGLYCSHARQILADITELRNLVLDKRKEYILCSNAFSIYGAQRFMSDEDRKKFDKETDMAIGQCTKLIKDLEVQIDSDKFLRQQDERKHLITIVNLLNVYLKEVLAIVAQLREIHVRKTRQIRKFCRLANLVDIYGTKLEKMQKEEEEKEEKLAKMKRELEENERRHKEIVEKENNRPQQKKEKTTNATFAELKPKQQIADESIKNEGWDEADEFPELDEEAGMIEDYQIKTGEGWSDAILDLSLESIDGTNNIENEQIQTAKSAKNKQQQKRLRIDDEFDQQEELPKAYEPINKAEQTQLVAENQKIFDKFTSTDSELQRIESHVAEIQRLQNMFAEKISEQEQDIDVIHSRTVYTLDNLEQANNYIREAIKNQANRRVIMIFCLLVLTFTLLFLDWYNP